MLDYIEQKPDRTKYINCHSLAIIDHQAMKVIRRPLKVMLELIRENIKSNKWNDTDILYMVPAGCEYHTRPAYRIKNDKFVGSIRDQEGVTRRSGSIIPLTGWIDSHDLRYSKVYIGRGNPFKGD